MTRPFWARASSAWRVWSEQRHNARQKKPGFRSRPGFLLCESGYILRRQTLIYPMKYLLPILVVTIALQLGAVPTAQAQTTAPAAAYTGHRYPGGPDSLRALVYRSTHTTTPASAGRMLVKVALTEDGQPRALTLVQPPERVRPDLQKAATAAVGYLKAHMQNWQLGTPDPEESTKKPSDGGINPRFFNTRRRAAT